MARGALNLSIPQLAELVGVGRGTIERLEAGAALKASTFEKVQAALEAAGVLFISANGEGPGVRLREAKPARKKAAKPKPEK